MGIAKSDWTVSLLRILADAILDVSNTRKRSPKLRARWWNAWGFVYDRGLVILLTIFVSKILEMLFGR